MDALIEKQMLIRQMRHAKQAMSSYHPTKDDVEFMQRTQLWVAQFADKHAMTENQVWSWAVNFQFTEQ